VEYKTNLTCKFSLYHYSATVSEIEEAMGRKASKSVNRGDPRPKADSPPFDRSSAHFDIVNMGEHEPARAISDCLDIIEASSSTELIDNGSLWIIVGLYDPEFVQVNLEDSLLKRLGDAGVSLTIENRSPTTG